MVTPAQCRAARALLNWSQGELRERTKMSQKTISDFELGLRQPYGRTLLDLRRAFEEAGVIFFDPEEGVGGSGVRLKWEVEIAQRGTNAASGEGGTTSGPIKALDQGMAEYWAERSDRWAKLSEVSRQAISMDMFGDPHAADEVFSARIE